MRGYVKKWDSANKAAKAAISARRRATEKQALPAWADAARIAEIYESARAAGMEVDHIIPLAGKTVCGLHVHQNLQLLSPQANRSKSNKYNGAGASV